MKTKNMTLSAVAFAVVLMMSGASVRVSALVPSILVCAKQMCYDMRHCQAQGVVEKPDAKKDPITLTPNAAAKSKSAENVQGVAPTSCNYLAYQAYLGCVGFDQAPSGDKDKDSKPNNSVVPTTNDK